MALRIVIQRSRHVKLGILGRTSFMLPSRAVSASLLHTTRSLRNVTGDVDKRRLPDPETMDADGKDATERFFEPPPMNRQHNMMLAKEKVARDPDQAVATTPEKDFRSPAPTLNADGSKVDIDEEDQVNVYNEETGEYMGPKGKEPTRYGDWESKGRCWDF